MSGTGTATMGWTTTVTPVVWRKCPSLGFLHETKDVDLTWTAPAVGMDEVMCGLTLRFRFIRVKSEKEGKLLCRCDPTS